MTVFLFLKFHILHHCGFTRQNRRILSLTFTLHNCILIYKYVTSKTSLLLKNKLKNVVYPLSPHNNVARPQHLRKHEKPVFSNVGDPQESPLAHKSRYAPAFFFFYLDEQNCAFLEICFHLPMRYHVKIKSCQLYFSVNLFAVNCIYNDLFLYRLI